MGETIAKVKADAIEQVLSILDSFHGNISFTYEQEINRKFFFLEVLLSIYGKGFQTIKRHKSTTISIYIRNHLCQMHGN